MLYKRFFKIYIIFVVVMSAAVNIGIKGTAIVILFGMLQSYACSALCTFNLYSCCNTVDEVHSCCSNELTPVASKSNPSGDCQDKHLEFSLSTGQFFSIAITDIAKVFSSESDLNVANPIADGLFDAKTEFDGQIYTGYSPPPAKEGIPVLISRMLIGF